MDFIEVYRHALSNRLCDDMIEAFQKRKNYARNVDNQIRKDSAIQLDQFESLLPLRNKVRDVLKDCWKTFSEKYEIYNEFESVISPTYKLQMSTTGGGFTFWHSEQGSDERMIGRFAVWMIYLNDDFEGGRTAFKHQNVRMTPEKGMCLIWPAAYTHMHRAEPDLKGTKYILTGWFRYPIPGELADNYDDSRN